jgi:hypothetical protein
MGQHYPRAMVGEKVPAHCARCRRITEHVIVAHTEHSAKVGHCVDPKHPPLNPLSKEQERRKKKQEQERMNSRLF